MPVSMVPGISSALAGPAAAGIPVTARGLASSFAVVIAHRAGDAALSLGSLAVLACLDTVVGDVAAFGQRSAGLGSMSSRGGWVTTSPAQDVRLA